MVSYRDILFAYEVCRNNKRNAASTIEFELNYISLLLQLWRDINNRVYAPSRSIAFLVTKPRLREIFAANFIDRIAHHCIDINLRPAIEKVLIETTCNNRVGKGTGAAVMYLEQAIKEVSKNYTRDCWVCKMDLQGFFMSIPKKLILHMITDFTRENCRGENLNELIYLLEKALLNHPEKNCFLKTPWIEWNKLAKNKSLFFVGEDRGLTLGDLISQLMANFLLNVLDQYVTKVLGFTHYVRYVDDFVIVSESKERIISSIPKIRAKLEEIGVTLHPNKFYLQHYRKGVEFVGAVIKPHRIYVHNRTVYNAQMAVDRFNKMAPTVDNLEKLRASLNSYLGFMKNFATFNIRKRLCDRLNEKWMEYITIPDDYSKIVIKKEFTKHEIIKNQLLKQKICYKNKLTKSISRFTILSTC